MTTTRRPDLTPDPGDEPYLKVLRPLVEAYFAFLRLDAPNIAKMGLTQPQFDVIVTLGDTEGMSCKELAQKTLVTKGTLTGVLDRLEKKGLIERVPSTEDRRFTFIQLTPTGKKRFNQVFPAQVGYLKPYFDSALTTAEMKALRELLLRLTAGLLITRTEPRKKNRLGAQP